MIGATRKRRCYTDRKARCQCIKHVSIDGSRSDGELVYCNVIS